MLSKYPQYVYIVFYKTDYGNYEAYGYSPIASEVIVESENRNAYPVRGIVDKDYYELIN